jgi:virginiamycin B lyase
MRAWRAAAAGMAIALSGALPAPARAQIPVALTGHVTSSEDGTLAGVMVTARRSVSKFAVTVVTDEHGVYQFPAGRIEPGHYLLQIRTPGFELTRPATADIDRGVTSIADLTVRRAGDPSTHLTSAEWLANWPGSERDKQAVYGCTSCHSLERIAKSTYDAAGFLAVISRMAGYGEGSDPVPDIAALARYLAGVNLSARLKWDYALTDLPRPSGRGTRVIITEYDLPRRVAQPHDVVVGPDGAVWFSILGEINLGRLDPATGSVKEFKLPLHQTEDPGARIDLEITAEGVLWLGLMHQGAIARFDPATETFQAWYLPFDASGPLNQLAIDHMAIDGKAWIADQGSPGLHRLDLHTGKFETIAEIGGAGRPRSRLQVASDAQNNGYFTDPSGQTIGRVDASTGNVTLHRGPGPSGGPRRIRMDAQDRLWFAEFSGERIGMFDTRTGSFRQWPLPTRHTVPYEAVAGRNGEVWSAGLASDRVQRLDSKTGQIVEYQLPLLPDPDTRIANPRRLFVDERNSVPMLWVASNQAATIILLEPID